MSIRYLSVCSGIEAASAAWMPLGWRPVAFSEIESFPASVLAHHHPGVPNWGDMTKYEEWPDEPIDLLCGGTPCQSFSVAGLRKGLADPRGNLMLTFGAIAAKYRPRWLVWENVPGVLSSNGGRDFGAFLGLLAELGYGFAYRVLDAQYVRVESHPRAVPQRRRRVFVVGHSGGQWQRAAAVLFERASLCGHPAPRREAGESVATGTLRSTDGGSCVDHARAHQLVSHALRGAGFDASEDGTGRGTPLVPAIISTTQVTSPGNYSTHAPCMAFPARMSGTQHASAENVAPSLGAMNPTAVAFQSSQSGVRLDDVHATLDSNNGSRRHNGALINASVRRLTPLECERLMGFQDSHTDVLNKGKPVADGPRYKALGNSWAVNCARWIGERIASVDCIAAGDSGSNEAMAELNRARDEALEAIK